jgi:hypothetical protein
MVVWHCGWKVAEGARCSAATAALIGPNPLRTLPGAARCKESDCTVVEFERVALAGLGSADGDRTSVRTVTMLRGSVPFAEPALPTV